MLSLLKNILYLFGYKHNKVLNSLFIKENCILSKTLNCVQREIDFEQRNFYLQHICS